MDIYLFDSPYPLHLILTKGSKMLNSGFVMPFSYKEMLNLAKRAFANSELELAKNRKPKERSQLYSFLIYPISNSKRYYIDYENYDRALYNFHISKNYLSFIEESGKSSNRLKNNIDYGDIELPYYVWHFLKQQVDLYKE